MASLLHILHVLYFVAKAIVIFFLLFVIFYAIVYIASLFIGLTFCKKEKDPRIKPFWKTIGKKEPLRDRE